MTLCISLLICRGLNNSLDMDSLMLLYFLVDYIFIVFVQMPVSFIQGISKTPFFYITELVILYILTLLIRAIIFLLLLIITNAINVIVISIAEN